jgi:hypothetical protein
MCRKLHRNCTRAKGRWFLRGERGGFVRAGGFERGKRYTVKNGLSKKYYTGVII